MIKVDGLVKIYRTEEVETTALDHVSLEVNEGEFTTIMGPSGCGKSTLLNVLGLLDRPVAGRYSLFGEDVSRCSERQRAAIRKNSIGFVFQSFNLINELTIRENIELPLLYQGMHKTLRARRVAAVLERFDLAARRNHYPRQLSGGQQQRAAVARAVVTRPKLILADEPTGNLDSTHGGDVMQSLAELNREGTTIVMVTHSPTYAGYGRRVIRLLDGRILADEAAVGAAS
jgi:putative ABC transport system ATP-binding protein